jgi:hypothetical protein
MAKNEISTLPFKADRQIAKLELAAIKRAATGRRSNLDITELPTVYAPNDNNSYNRIDNPNTGGLVIGRPWTADSPPPPPPTITLIINLDGTVAPVTETWNDQTTYGRNATLQGGTGYTSTFGGEVTLDGINDYVALTSNFIDWLNLDIGVSIWVKPTGNGVLLGQQNSDTVNSASGYVPAIYIGTDNKLYTSLFWHDDKPAGIPVTVNDSDWHMITVTYKFSTKEQITYVDGTQISSIIWDVQQKTYNSTYYYFLGAGANDSWANNPTDPFLQCSIGSFKAWHGLLDGSAVKTEFDNTKTRFLAGSHTLTATHQYGGTSSGSVYIDLTKFPSAVNIPVGATITSSVLPGPATVAVSKIETGNPNGWQINYFNQSATRALVDTDQFTFTWTV